MSSMANSSAPGRGAGADEGWYSKRPDRRGNLLAEPRPRRGRVIRLKGRLLRAGGRAPADHPSGDAHGRAVRRDIMQDHGVGADAGAVPHGDGADDLGPGTEEHAISQPRALAPFG